MLTKSTFCLTALAALLTSASLWVFLRSESENFIIPASDNLNGQLHFMKSATSSEGFGHVPSSPFLHVSVLDGDEFWSTRPIVRSPDGKCLPEMDFSTEEDIFGSLYQDVCYDSLHLTFESCFGDLVEVTENTLPRGKIRLATDRLDGSVGYVRSPLPKDIDFSSIMIVLRTYGCFSFREETLSVLKQSDGSAMVHYVLPKSKDTNMVISAVDAKVLFGEIIKCQKSWYGPDRTNPIVALIKVDNYITMIYDPDQDLSPLVELMEIYQKRLRVE